MKMFSDCSGECCVCVCGDGGCLAVHGDDDFYLASKEAIVSRLDNGKYKSYTDVMIGTLKSRYGYDYKANTNDATLMCVSSNEYKDRKLKLNLKEKQIMLAEELIEKLNQFPKKSIVMIPNADYDFGNMEFDSPYYVPVGNVVCGFNEEDGCIFLEKYEDDD